MHKATRAFKFTKRPFILVVMAFVMILAIGCRANESSATTASELTTNTLPAAATQEPMIATEEAVAVVATEPPPTDECLICHTDKEMLIHTADPEEEVISENEGEG